jgi:hypothetical protein
LLQLIDTSPTDLPRLVVDMVERAPEMGTVAMYACDHLTATDWPHVIEVALDSIEMHGEETCGNDVIARASMQCLPLLHPHLERIFRIRPARDTYSEPWPWRDSGDSQYTFLARVIKDKSADLETRGRAWRALLETRTPAALKLAIATFDEVMPKVRFGKSSLNDFLNRLGYGDRTPKSLRRLDHPHRVIHLRFDPSEPPVANNPIRSRHLTWNFPPSSQPAAFGGVIDSTCNCCGQRLHRIIELDPAPASLGVKSIQKLTLATCLSCLGWEGDMQVAFYEHDDAGKPRDITQTSKATPQYPSAPLRETTVHLVETPPRWHWQDMGLSNATQNLHRLGGHQCWVQDAEYPRCPKCETTMAFLMELDDDLPRSDGKAHQWGAGGMGYFHWCDACKVSGAFWQCT